MESRKYFWKNPLVIVCFGCAMAFAVACGDDDDSGETPTGGTKATAGTNSGGKAGNTSGGTTGTGGKSGAAGKTNTEGGTGAEGGGGATGPIGGEAGMGGAPDCNDADHSCFKCVPKTDEQFLNQCPITGCEPFDNTKLTSLKNGALPTL
jgi:hypothetical protein